MQKICYYSNCRIKIIISKTWIIVLILWILNSLILYFSFKGDENNMARVRPFNALRPNQENTHLVASVPYDVVNRKEAKEIVGNNDLSFLHITRAEIDLPDSVDAYSKEVYEKAKENREKI